MNIIITGGSSGIGLGLKKRYEKLGARVYDISLDGEYACDVSNEKAMREAFARIDAPKIDMLIACAGFGISGAVELVENDQIENIFKVNVLGAVNAVKCALPRMEKGGKIVLISSVLALFPTPFRGYYCASKSALSTLADTLRMELFESGIQVTAICPSDIKTNFSKNRIKSLATNERYGSRVEGSMQHIDKNESKRMSLDKAIIIITRWIDKKHLKPMYIMTFKFKMLYFFKNIFPKSWYLRICNKMFNKKAN